MSTSYSHRRAKSINKIIVSLGGMMNFFDALGARAWNRLRLSMSVPDKIITEAAIVATIEALKEMGVGEPIVARVSHYLSRYLPGEERTEYLVQTERGWRNLLKLEGHHGTDGEEVVVMVFKKP